MSLNDIELTPLLIADLYNDKLIEQKQNQTAGTKPGFLGNYEKKILVITIDHDAVYMNDSQLAFLTNVLGACKLGLVDVGIVNWQNLDDSSRKTLIHSLSPRIVLMFGLEPDALDLAVNFPAFQVQQVNTSTYLHAPLLSEIESNKELKLQLWNSLKRIFSI